MSFIERELEKTLLHVSELENISLQCDVSKTDIQVLSYYLFIFDDSNILDSFIEQMNISKDSFLVDMNYEF